ncbi:MAG: 4'-phosphopantetheinyl transferase superfamily protein [Desulfatitalea sp.]|nr:4'-phosphopantetheinyl transferase superfamily protein [Desulfatitalea sp.]NNK01889.1 4'-phosphopantetheinyl transferase superfamily protein [Desulfatitalea sp.]
MKEPIALLSPEANEIHLWFAFLNEIKNSSLLSSYAELLSEEEKNQWQRFHFDKHRHQYLVTRALVRTTLSRYADVAPTQWRFSKNRYGRPDIMPMPGIPPLRFNLSHTEGMVALAIVLTQDIGVDVENNQREPIPVQLIDRYFSPQEVVDFKALPKSRWRDRFFDYWTLKESFIKARGMGLSLALDQFTFYILSEQQPIGFSVCPEQKVDPVDWQFWLLTPSTQHTAAVAINKKSKERYHLCIKKIIPLENEQPLNCLIKKQSA